MLGKLEIALVPRPLTLGRILVLDLVEICRSQQQPKDPKEGYILAVFLGGSLIARCAMDTLPCPFERFYLVTN